MSKITLIILSSFLLVVLYPVWQIHANSALADDEGSSYIEWSPDVRLKWSDFQATRQPTRGFAVAASTCGFGYEGLVYNNDIQINVYVRFYKNESWHDQKYDLFDVLAYEQLHFDICELFGWMLYWEVVNLCKQGKLSEKNFEVVFN